MNKHYLHIPITLFICILIFAPLTTFSNHIFGGELEANHTSNGTYKIRFTIYVDCGRVTSYPISTSIDAYDINNVKTAITASIVKRDTLPAVQNKCAATTGGTCVGRIIYEGTANLPLKPGGYTLAVSDYARNQNIVNIANAQSAGLIYALKLPGSDVVNTWNSSPVFTAIPPADICTNLPMSIDFSASDPDGDILKYKFVTPYDGGSTKVTTPPFKTVTFLAPYTATDPFNCGMSIDPFTGIITGTPKNIGLFTIGVLVEEYRNGVKIGEKIRDFTYTVIACAPKVTFNDPNLFTCANLPVQFGYNFSGTLKPGTTPKWNFGDPASGANNTSTIANPKHQYSTLGKYVATITLEDDCNNIITNTINVNITETKAKVNADGPHCKGETVTLTSNDAGCANMTWYSDKTSTTPIATGCTYSFVLNKDSSVIYFEPYTDPKVYTVGKPANYETWPGDNEGRFDVFLPVLIDGFTVQGGDWSATCNTSASFSVIDANGVTVAGPVTTKVTCDRNKPATVLTGLGLNVPAGNGYRLVASGVTLNQSLGTATSVNQIGLININNSGAFANWNVSSLQKCAVRDSIKIKTSCPCPDTSLSFATPICADVSTDLNSLKKNSTAAGTWSIVQSPVGGNPATLNGSIFNANKNGDAGIYIVRYSISGTINAGCATYNERTIIINKKERALINRPQGPFCSSEGIKTISLNSASDFGTWSGKGIIDVNNGTFDPNNNIGANLLTYTTSGACSATDTITIVVVSQKISNILTTDTSTCLNATPFKIRLSNNSTANGTWSSVPTGIVNNVGLITPQGTAGINYKVYYTLSGNANCSANDSVQISFIQKDTAKISLNQGPFCEGSSAVDLSLETISNSGLFSGVGITNASKGTFDPMIAKSGSKIISYTTDGICPHTDTVHLEVKAKTKSEILTNDTTVCENSTAFNLRLSSNSTIGGLWTNGSTILTNKVSTSTVGKQKIYYYTKGVKMECDAIDSVTIDIKPRLDASVQNVIKKDFCPNDNPIQLSPLNSAGVWWSSPTGFVSASGSFDPSNAPKGKIKIYYGIADLCGDTSETELNVHDYKDPAITPFGPICENSKAIKMQSKNQGNWLIDNQASNDIFDPSKLSPGVHTVELQINDFCPTQSTINVEIKENPITDFDADQLAGCIPLKVNLIDLSNSIALASTWYISENGKIIDSVKQTNLLNYSFNRAGCFNIQLKNSYDYGCVSQYVLPSLICAEDTPVANFTFLDLPKNIEDPTVNLQNLSSSANSFLWKIPEGTPDTSNLFNAYTRFNTNKQDTFKVTLIAKNQYCVDSISKWIIIHDIATIHTPNAFTPNGDGLNDLFYPTGRNVSSEKYHFMVFNRWGEMIFETHTPFEAWNGKKYNSMEDSQIDVYIWKLEIYDQYEEELETLLGTVSLIR